MITITTAGNCGKDAETRTAGSGTVTSWSLAAKSGFGDRATTTWFDCSLWGKRGEALKEYISKGGAMTVSGQLTTREYEGKTYLGIDVNEVALQGGPRNEPVRHREIDPPKPVALDDEIPF